MNPLLLRVPLLLLGFAVLMGAVLVYSLVRSGREAQDRVDRLPPLETAAIQNGDFRSGLTYWDTRHISAAAQTEVTESAQRRTFARLTKPPEWKRSATMMQELNVRRLHADVRVRIVADFRIPQGGGPATIYVECMDTDAPQTEEAQYGQLLTSESLPSPADGGWHPQVVDFFAPSGTDQLRIFVTVAGDSIVDVTGVILTTAH